MEFTECQKIRTLLQMEDHEKKIRINVLMLVMIQYKLIPWNASSHGKWNGHNSGSLIRTNVYVKD